MLDVSGKRKI